jgi:predicted secreted protein
MSITAAIVLYSTTWFMVLLMVLPMRGKTQEEAGHVVPGSARSAPEDAGIAWKAKLTTLIATVLFAIFYGIITSGWITIADLDRLRPDLGPSEVQD